VTIQYKRRVYLSFFNRPFREEALVIRLARMSAFCQKLQKGRKKDRPFVCMKNLLIEYPVLINYSLILSYKHKIVAETSHIPCEYVNISVLNTDLFEDFLNRKFFNIFQKILVIFPSQKFVLRKSIKKKIQHC
jgi:hypothetical protein